MLASRHRRLVLAVGVSAVACADLHALTGGNDAGLDASDASGGADAQDTGAGLPEASADAGADATDAADARANDAARDADAAADAAADGASSYCASEAAAGRTHTLCSDFDETPFTAIAGATSGNWELGQHGIGTAGYADDSTFTSPPHAFRAKLQADSTNGTNDTVFLDLTAMLDKPPGTVRVATDFHPNTCAPGQNVVTFLLAGVWTGATAYTAYGLYRLANGTYAFYERPFQNGNAGSATPHSIPAITDGAWTRLEVDLTLGASAAVVVREAGNVVLDTSVAPVTPIAKLTLDVGMETTSPFGGCDFAFDDLAIDVH
jgi:hypothetical protein